MWIEDRWDCLHVEVPETDVPIAARAAAERIRLTISTALGLAPMPRIRWLPSATRNIRGIVHPDRLDEIWVRAQDPAAAVETAAHELKHVRQIRDWGGYVADPSCSMPAREEAATRFGLEVRRRFEAGLPLADRPPAPAPAPKPPATTPSPSRTSSGTTTTISYAEKLRREAVREQRFGAARRAYQEQVDRMTAAAPRYGMASAPAARPAAYFHKTLGRVVDCTQCGYAIKVNTTHRCPVAAQLAKSYR